MVPVSVLALGIAAFLPALRVSEIHFAPPDAALEYVELVNVGTTPVDLAGLGLADSRGIETPVPAGLSPLPPGAFVVLVRDIEAFEARWPGVTAVEISPWPALNNTFDDVVVLRGGVPIEHVAYRSDWLDPRQPPGRSLERVDPRSDRIGPAAWTTSRNPSGGTPGIENGPWATVPGRVPAQGDFRVTEVLYEPQPGRLPAQPEFVEIAARSIDAVDTNGLYLVQERPGSDPDSIRIGWTPDAMTRGDVAVAAWPVSGYGRLDLDLQSAFPSSAGRLPAGRIWPAASARPLRNEGGTITLHAPDGTVVDRIPFGPDMHHPAVAQTAGRSVERVDWDGPSDEPSNWTSSIHPDGATPGYRSRAGFGPSRPDAGLVIDPPVFDPEGPAGTGHAALRVNFFPQASITDIRIFDLDGRRIRTLADGRLSVGTETAYWDGTDDRGVPAPPGPYVVLAVAWAPDGRRRSERGVVVLARR